jgi:hypothetical protein
MLQPNFKDMLTASNDVDADDLLIGAYLMAAHGCPRATVRQLDSASCLALG